MINQFLTESQALFEYSRALRRDFHQHPELGFKEVRTSEIIARELGQSGLEVTSGIAQTGVVGLLKCVEPGPVVLLRFDIDGLPIKEETGVEYASVCPGVMHACGHDAHTAIGLTVARLLHNHRKDIKGTVKLMFQPAEEGLGGATQMIAGGVLENPRPDVALSLHVWNDDPVGMVTLAPGPMMAGAEKFAIRITGVGGHGALPHRTVDPVLCSAQIITALQSIVSRNVPPVKTVALSICMIQAGAAFNIIPETVDLAGTIRTFEPDVRQLVLTRFEQIVKGIAGAMGCQADLDIIKLTPSVINDEKITQRVTQVAKEVLPDSPIVSNFQTMCSEDMAFVLEKIPGCFILFGSANPDKGLTHGHHSPKFDIDETVLPRAAALMTAATLDLLKK